MIEDILKKVHRKVAKDTDYPEAGSEDLLVRLDHVDDAISEYEDCVKEGYQFKELLVPPITLTFGGTGSDDLPDDFLSFVRNFNDDGMNKAELLIGSTLYSEIKAGEGRQSEQQELAPYVFWVEGGNIHTLPAASGSITCPYLKKHTRYTTGAEATEPEMENSKFIEDYVTAKVFLDNDDDTLYQSFMTSAAEKLKQMKYNAII